MASTLPAEACKRRATSAHRLCVATLQCERVLDLASVYDVPGVCIQELPSKVHTIGR